MTQEELQNAIELCEEVGRMLNAMYVPSFYVNFWFLLDCCSVEAVGSRQ